MLSEQKIVVTGNLSLEKVEKYLKRVFWQSLGTYLSEQEKDKLAEEIKLHTPRNFKAFVDTKLIFWNGPEGKLTLRPDDLVFQLCDPVTIKVGSDSEKSDSQAPPESDDSDFLLSPLDESRPNDEIEDRKVLLARSVNDLHLSIRSRKCMIRLGINTLGDLIKKTESELCSCKDFGAVPRDEMKEKLAMFGLKLRDE